MKTKVFYQITPFDCGIQVLKSMYFYYSKGSYLDFKEDFNHLSYSFKELKDIALTNGLVLSGYKVNNDCLKSIKPCIVLLEYNNYKHFVFFLKLKKRYAFFIDPNFGKRKMKSEVFLKRFTKNALLFESIDIKKKKRNRINKFYLLTILCEIILSLPCFLLLFMFIKHKSISLLLLIMMFLSLFVRKFYLLFAMKLFDKKSEKIMLNNNVDENIVKKMYKFKESLFSYIPRLYGFVLSHFSFFFYACLIEKGFYLCIFHFCYLIYCVFALKSSKEHIYLLGEFSQITTNIYRKYRKLNNYTHKYITKRELFKVLFMLMNLSLCFIFDYFYWQSKETLFSIALFYFILLQRDDFFNLSTMYKDIEIGQTIYRNMKNGDE